MFGRGALRAWLKRALIAVVWTAWFLFMYVLWHEADPEWIMLAFVFGGAVALWLHEVIKEKLN